MRYIAPSILSADFGRLKEEIEMLNASEADYIHVDIMDGVFVPNLSFGFPVMEVLQKYSIKPLDVHLMIVHPERYVERFCEHGAFSVGFHLEATDQPLPILEMIKKCGVRTCLAINPDIDERRLFPYLDKVDMVLLMSVFAGFGGQKFIDKTLVKIQNIKQKIVENNLSTKIEVDGGINLENAATVFHHGADVLVAGSAIFHSSDPQQTISQMKNLV